MKNLKPENLYRLNETFLDEVFDIHNKLEKMEWIQLVSEKCKWILKPETLRTKVYELLKLTNESDRVCNDPPDGVCLKRWSSRIEGSVITFQPTAECASKDVSI